MTETESIVTVAMEVLEETEVVRAMRDLARHSEDAPFPSLCGPLGLLASAVRTLMKAYFRLWKETHGKPS